MIVQDLAPVIDIISGGGLRNTNVVPIFAGIMKDSDVTPDKMVCLLVLKKTTSNEILNSIVKHCWDTLERWLVDSQKGDNYAFTKSVLECIFVLPVTLQLLEKSRNNIAKVVKKLRNEGGDDAIKELAAKTTKKFKQVVKEATHAQVDSKPSVKKQHQPIKTVLTEDDIQYMDTDDEEEDDEEPYFTYYTKDNETLKQIKSRFQKLYSFAIDMEELLKMNGWCVGLTPSSKLEARTSIYVPGFDPRVSDTESIISIAASTTTSTSNPKQSQSTKSAKRPSLEIQVVSASPKKENKVDLTGVRRPSLDKTTPVPKTTTAIPTTTTTVTASRKRLASDSFSDRQTTGKKSNSELGTGVRRVADATRQAQTQTQEQSLTLALALAP